MNMKNIVLVIAAVVLILVAVKLLNRDEAPRTDLGRSIDRAGADLKEGVNDAKRDIEDATE
jgi:hypothetical protein